MRTAVDDVQQRHGHRPRGLSSETAVEREPGVGCCGLGDCERDPEDRVRSQAALRRRAVEFDQRVVDRPLVVCVKAHDRGGDLAVDMPDCARDALAEPGGVAVTQLDGFVLTRGGPGRNRRHAAGTGSELDLDLDGRVAARVEDLPRVDGGNGAHA